MKRELSDREKLILREVVAQYVLTADPISSRTLSKRLKGRFSPATIRNAMADLEELGLLDHPHTSAGRVPTELGYRLFVDDLMAHARLSPREKELLDREITRLGSTDVVNVLEQTAHLLAEITNLLCVVMSPRFQEGILHRIDLIGIGGEKILAVITIQSGMVRSLLLEVTAGITRDEIEWVAAFLNQRLSGLSLSEIRHSIGQRLKDGPMDNFSVLRTMVDRADQVFSFDDRNAYLVEGVSHLALQPEFYDVDQLRRVLELLEDRKLFVHLFARREGGVEVRIGRENALVPLSSLSVVSATYKYGNLGGAIGLIGPTRMNYPKAVSIVEYTARKIDSITGEQ
ncbi:MAG: heat-inducible transcription repressor HrcA [Candidatus Zixiibacteriota bacterium]|nr:MAG: heat-inducible transcription repressor HrcA [candidate division Zixibacteria bacterium]